MTVGVLMAGVLAADVLTADVLIGVVLVAGALAATRRFIRVTGGISSISESDNTKAT